MCKESIVEYDHTKGDRKEPLYLMCIDDKKRFFPLMEAGVLHASMWSKVEIVGLVLDLNGEVREITRKERVKISAIADEYSESK